MSNNEELIWENSSSQVLNFWNHLTTLILISVFIGLGFINHLFSYIGIPIVFLWGTWNYLVVKNKKYKLTNQRLIMREGVLNRITDEIELYRVKDHRLEQPFFLRIFGLGNIILVTSDQLNREIMIRAVKDSENIREQLRRLIEDRRVTRGVREFDTN